jgi:hypothetical protein
MWSNFFESGGFGMYPVAIFGFVLVASGVLLMLRPERRLVPIVACAAVLTLGAGLLGTAVGIVNTLHYVHTLPAGDRLDVTAVGCAESLHNLVLALMLVTATGILALVAAVRASRAPAAAVVS